MSSSEGSRVPMVTIPLSERGLSQLCEMLAEEGLMSGVSFDAWSRAMSAAMHRKSRDAAKKLKTSSKKPAPSNGAGTKKKASQAGPATASPGSGPGPDEEKKSSSKKTDGSSGKETKAQAADRLSLSGITKVLNLVDPTAVKDLASWEVIKKDSAWCHQTENLFRRGMLGGDYKEGDQSPVPAETVRQFLEKAGLTEDERRVSRRYYPVFAHLKEKKPAVDSGQGPSQ